MNETLLMVIYLLLIALLVVGFIIMGIKVAYEERSNRNPKSSSSKPQIREPDILIQLRQQQKEDEATARGCIWGIIIWVVFLIIYLLNFLQSIGITF